MTTPHRKSKVYYIPYTLPNQLTQTVLKISQLSLSTFLTPDGPLQKKKHLLYISLPVMKPSRRKSVDMVEWQVGQALGIISGKQVTLPLNQKKNHQRNTYLNLIRTGSRVQFTLESPLYDILKATIFSFTIRYSSFEIFVSSCCEV